MIQSIFIKNFKKFDRKTIVIDQHNIIIGENDSGKSTILQALDIFFNHEKIDKYLVRNIGEPVEIAIRYNGNMYKKIFTGASYKLNEIEGNFDEINNLKYIYISTGKYEVLEMIQQLSIAKVLENTNQELINELKRISQESIDQVISGIDENLLVLNNQDTSILGEEKFNYNLVLNLELVQLVLQLRQEGQVFKKTYYMRY